MPHGHWNDADDEFSKFLFRYRYIRHSEAPEACQWIIDANYDFVGENYRTAEAPFREEIEYHIRLIGSEETPPKPSEEAAYFLGVRFGVVQTFVISLGLSQTEGLKTVFLHPPDMTFAETAQWLLLDWWNVFGPLKAVTSRIEEEFWDVHDPIY